MKICLKVLEHLPEEPLQSMGNALAALPFTSAPTPPTRCRRRHCQGVSRALPLSNSGGLHALSRQRGDE